MDGVTSAAIVSLLGNVIAFSLGWITKKKRFSAETDSFIVANVKLSMELYKITCDEKIKYISDNCTDLKIRIEVLIEENIVLKKKIATLENKK